jgi:hypothetical protein
MEELIDDLQRKCGGCEFFDLPKEKDLGRKPNDWDGLGKFSRPG